MTTAKSISSQCPRSRKCNEKFWREKQTNGAEVKGDLLQHAPLLTKSTKSGCFLFFLFSSSLQYIQLLSHQLIFLLFLLLSWHLPSNAVRLSDSVRTATLGRIWVRFMEVIPLVLLPKLWNRWPFKILVVRLSHGFIAPRPLYTGPLCPTLE
jgi:hypothetical protein